jgi:hypothetical protein
MKNLRWLIFICFVGINSVIVAQQEFKEWAPMGANWLYIKETIGGEYYCVRIAHERDTIALKHKYKVFDVYALQIRPAFRDRFEVLLGSYYISTVGDTVFEYCRGEKKETFYIDRDSVGVKFYPYRDCDPSDTVWVRLDTVYYKNMYSSGPSAKYKMRVYSSNAVYRWGAVAEKDTVPEIMPYRSLTTAYNLRFSNFSYHKYLVHNTPCRCIYPIVNYPAVSPDYFDCYYDPNLGSFVFYSGQCWFRNAYMSVGNVAEKASFKLFPNPAKDKLYLVSDRPEELIYILYDSKGKYLLSDKFQQSTSLDISHLSPSTYYICVQNKSEVIGRQKFIKD